MKALFIVAVMLISGCASGIPTDQSHTICKNVDTTAGVICYFNCQFTTNSGISCVKVEGRP